MSTLFAVISGTSVIQVVLWLIRYVGLPEPFAKIARVVLGVAAVILIINALLSLVGSPFILGRSVPEQLHASRTSAPQGFHLGKFHAERVEFRDRRCE